MRQHTMITHQVCNPFPSEKMGVKHRETGRYHNSRRGVDKKRRISEVDEVEKRKRRVQKWQEKKLEQIVLTARRKSWTLEGESDDDEEGDMDVDDVNNNENVEFDDPLDVYMNSVVLPEADKLLNNNDKYNVCKTMGWTIPGEEDSDGDVLEEETDDEEVLKVEKKQQTKVEKLSCLHHSEINYIQIRKNIYNEVNEIQNMTDDEVSDYRMQLELKVEGKDVPKPIKMWYHTGLPTSVLIKIEKMKYEKPMPIQAQALPVIMSGRDSIGVSNTGSGKTLAFVLPMLRHIRNQPKLGNGDGPIGLIMAPTRELVQQIHKDVERFTGLSCVAVYGGSSVAQQIKELKRGVEVVVCTPGRMIDMLCMSSGKITNLRRVTYVVLDEADRMFDMGFEPQINAILQNTRPDRQTVLFSATFPRQMEALAQKVLNNYVKIRVGGTSVVNKDITQLVEIIPKSERFVRLLELLKEWYEKGKILVFVETQKSCDALFRALLECKYACLPLHGDMDQSDRVSTLSDFKSNVCNLLIATSVAARGLDVKELELVINYDVPKNEQDYIHRVGRTGRAGRKGCAVTFLSSDDEGCARYLVKALEMSNQVVPDALKALADAFISKKKQGLVQALGSGYGGSGFKFNEEEDGATKAAKKARAKEYGIEEEISDSEDDVGMQSQQAGPIFVDSQQPSTSSFAARNEGAAKAVALDAAKNLKSNLARIQARSLPGHYEELEINDLSEHARWKVTRRETLSSISESTGAGIIIRGEYIQPGMIPGPGKKKLYLFIEGRTEQSVKTAKVELERVLEGILTQASSLPSSRMGRYSVV